MDQLALGEWRDEGYAIPPGKGRWGMPGGVRAHGGKGGNRSTTGTARFRAEPRAKQRIQTEPRERVRQNNRSK